MRSQLRTKSAVAAWAFVFSFATVSQAASKIFTSGTASSFTVTATGFPAPVFSETGALPAGVTFTSAGVLSRSASTVGSYSITITASNGVTPNATQKFTLVTLGLARPSSAPPVLALPWARRVPSP